MIQMRPNGGLPYAPFRDLVNCFPSLARRAVQLLERDEREDELGHLIAYLHLTDEQLGEAVKSLASFINLCRKPELDSPDKVLVESGFLALPLAVQVILLFRVGQVAMATFYANCRDALRVDEKPFALDALLETAEQVLSKLLKKT